MVREMILFGK